MIIKGFETLIIPWEDQVYTLQKPNVNINVTRKRPREINDFGEQKTKIKEEYLREKEVLIDMYKWMRRGNRSVAFSPKFASSKLIDEFNELFKSKGYDNERKPLLLRFWIINERIRKFSGQLESTEFLATETEITNFFNVMENRERNQGVYDDGQSKWPKRIKKDQYEGDTLFNFNIFPSYTML